MNQAELLRTHIRDVKTGRIIARTPYRLCVEENKPNRYLKNGTWYFENGTPADQNWELKAAEEAAKAAQKKLNDLKASRDAEEAKNDPEIARKIIETSAKRDASLTQTGTFGKATQPTSQASSQASGQDQKKSGEKK